MTHTFLIEAFRHQVRSQGDRVALIVESEDESIAVICWRVLAEQVDETAGELLSRFQQAPATLPRHVGHLSDNRLDDIIVALASMSLGTIEFPFDNRLDDNEIARRWSRIGGLWHGASPRDGQIEKKAIDARAMVQQDVPQQDVPQQDVPQQDVPQYKSFADDAAALVLWTSGTTGEPRGVTLSSRNLSGNAAAKLRAVPQSTLDVRLCVLPLSHAYARTCDFGTWLQSGCQLAVTLGYSGLRRLAPLVRPTVMNVVPSIANRLLADPDLEGLERLRLLGCGGAAISESAFKRWQQLGVTVIQGYGLTEASPVICSATPDNAMPGRVGQLVDGWESTIRNGQLFVRGPHAMLGYWDDPKATAKRINSEGWLMTGDQVEIDPVTGQTIILGRADDVIVLDSARKVHPAIVERAVMRVAGVIHTILIHRDPLQLWFDAADDCDAVQLATEIRSVLDEFDGLRHCSIQRFEKPLSTNNGELTLKGTIRRRRILETRFSDQAGS